MAITKSFLKEIYALLQTDFFCIEDFEVTLQEETEEKFPSVTIAYTYDGNYYFKMSFTEDDFEIERVPGDIKLYEMETAEVKSELFSSLNVWLNNLKNELLSEPSIRQFERYKEDIEQKFSEIEKNFETFDDKYFSREEASEFKGRLESLEQAFTEKLEKETENKEKLEKEIANIKIEFEFLKNQLESFSKANWLKVFVTKTLNWGRKNPELVKTIGQITTEMLPENIKGALPSGMFDGNENTRIS